jgi:hypothetical protein
MTEWVEAIKLASVLYQEIFYAAVVRSKGTHSLSNSFVRCCVGAPERSHHGEQDVNWSTASRTGATRSTSFESWPRTRLPGKQRRLFNCCSSSPRSSAQPVGETVTPRRLCDERHKLYKVCSIASGSTGTEWIFTEVIVAVITRLILLLPSLCVRGREETCRLQA